ncbi:hypothetical protein MKZ38_002439 [Zalerion maritima]|uniref:Uncharacterized protein n=1 Tax=Zalerion maritima TaxID=339359 RepID=A0AAD5RQI0_9PEZI|nr:hypothetical protein MKZ38_002439 [Zalerion maritima]
MPAIQYWDPGNLLQITGYGKPGEIQCVGRAKKSFRVRCRWTKDGGDPDVVEINRILASMAAKPPSDITTTEVRRLAGLCLCTDFHISQQEETVQIWQRVVRHAADIHRSITTNNADTTKELTEKVEHLTSAKQAAELSNERLRDKLAGAKEEEIRFQSQFQTSKKQARQQLKQDNTRISEMELELSNARSTLRSVEGQNKALQLHADKLADKLSSTTDKKKDDSSRRESRPPLEKLEDSIDTILHKLSGDKKKTRLLAGENARLKEKLQALQGQSDARDSQARLLRAELSDKQEALQQAQARGAELGNANAALARQVDVLQHHMHQLESDAALRVRGGRLENEKRTGGGPRDVASGKPSWTTRGTTPGNAATARRTSPNLSSPRRASSQARSRPTAAVGFRGTFEVLGYHQAKEEKAERERAALSAADTRQGRKALPPPRPESEGTVGFTPIWADPEAERPEEHWIAPPPWVDPPQ